MKKLCLILIAAVQICSAQAVRTGFATNAGQQGREDDISSLANLGFNVNFGNATFNTVYISTNGYLTFGERQTGYDPERLTTNPQKILAAFYADVDTRNPQSGQISWGQGSINNRPAFAVTWNNVGYYDAKADKRNTFQIVIIDQSVRAPGDFDFEFNYNSIQWEAGDPAPSNTGGRGRAGLCVDSLCRPPTIGYSNGLSGAGALSFEYPGSNIAGSFLDTGRTPLRNQQFGSSGQNGRLLFSVRSGQVNPLTITGIDPTSVNAASPATAITINGTGFAPNATVTWTRSGTSTPLTATVVDSTKITATIPANQLATAGVAQIVVANPNGTPSAPRDFPINGIADVTPSSAAQLSAATPIVLTGAGFAAGATVRWTFNGQNTNLDNVVVASATRITATVPANLLATAGTAQISVVQGNTPSNTRPFTVSALPALTGVTISPSAVASTSTQPTVTLTLGAPTAAPLTGTLTLSFTPNVTVPAGFTFQEVKFASSNSPVLNFTAPAGATQITLPSNGQFSQGTVAGTITLAMTAATMGGVSVLPANRPSTTITVGRAAPSITDGSVKILNLTATGFTVEIQGFSTTRELVSANLTFSSAPGAALDGTTTFPVTLTNAQSVWFDTDDGRNNGGRFALRIPFTYSGNTTALGTVSATLTNSTGTSPAVTGGQ